MSSALRNERGEKTVWLLLFLGGFLAGIALICLMPQLLVGDTGILDAQTLGAMRYLDINQNGLFLYALRQRLGAVAFLVFLSVAGASGIASILFLCWSGLSAGAVLTALSMRFGLRGLVLFCACILPQQLLLIPGFLMLLDWCFKRPEKRKLLLPLAVVITGCFLESYVNPIILKVVLQLF